MSTFSSAAKNSSQKSAKKLFVSLVCLLRSFSKDLSAGKRYFVEADVNCVSALRASNRGVGHVREEFHEDVFKLTSMELCAYMLNNFNRLQDPNFG